MNGALKFLTGIGLACVALSPILASEQSNAKDPYAADRVSRQVLIVRNPTITSVQGRAGELSKIQRAAKRCGVRNADLALMVGPAFFKSPEEPGAELTFPTAHLTAANQRCLKRNSAAWRNARTRAPETTK